MNNREKLQDLIQDILLLDDGEFHFGLERSNVETWDSMSVVAIAVGVHEEFGYHFTPEEATGIRSVQDIVDLLETKGISFAD
jgi:acyl carrier protein